LVFAEGRAEYNGHQSRDGVDFARAVTTLGVDRGINAFTRYGFLKRSGKAYVAAPLGVFPVRERRNVDLLREIDNWLEFLKWACAGEEVPARFKTVLRRIEAAIFDYCRYSQGKDDATWFQNILVSLGAAERELAVGDVPPDKRRVRRPLPTLSADWIEACDDDSTEFRLARSLAFMRGDPQKTGPIRRYLEPVHLDKGHWAWTERGGHVVWAGGDIVGNLGAILARRLMDSEKTGENLLPLDSPFPAKLADIAKFLSDGIEFQKLADLLWGLMLVECKVPSRSKPTDMDHPMLTRAYALLKLTLLPGRLEWVERNGETILRLIRPEPNEPLAGISVRPEPAVLANLRAGHVAEACEIAARRLRASGFTPLGFHRPDGSRRLTGWSGGAIPAIRLLAALLFPISAHAVNHLADLVLRRPAEATQT
jgi:CRISPR-associated protein Csx17